MRFDDLLNLLNARDWDAIVALSEPEDALPRGLSIRNTLRLLEELRDVWLEILLTDVPREPSREVETQRSKELSRRILVVALYYDELVKRLLDSSHDFAQPWPVFSPDNMRELRERLDHLGDYTDSDLRRAYIAAIAWTRDYQLCRLGLFLLRENADELTPDLVSDMTWAGFVGLRDLAQPLLPEPPKPLVALFGSLAASCADDWARGHAEDGFILQSDYRAALSKAELNELQDLASRRPQFVARCGSERAVDRLFEDRLDEILQRLGFVVVRARPGSRAGDLLCLSSEGDSAFSLLVEAKTTRKPYTLPASDARAIKEYVERIRAKLSLTPPLRFVLIVTRDPARTVGTKMDELEAEVKVPIRYLEARQLGNLQRALSGAGGLLEFVGAVLAGPKFVTDETLEALAAARHQAARQWADLIQTALQPVRP